MLSLARSDDIVRTLALGPDPEAYLDAIAAFAKAGYDRIYIHQIGPDQRGFLDFYRKEIAPALHAA